MGPRRVEMRRFVSLVLTLAVVGFSASGCAPEQAELPNAIAIRTGPPPGPNRACMAALAIGRLVEDPRSGLAIASVGGEVTPVVWPFGFSAHVHDGGIALLDQRGAVVANVGDRIQMGGGLGRDDAWYVCPGEVEAAP